MATNGKRGRKGRKKAAWKPQDAFMAMAGLTRRREWRGAVQLEFSRWGRFSDESGAWDIEASLTATPKDGVVAAVHIGRRSPVPPTEAAKTLISRAIRARGYAGEFERPRERKVPKRIVNREERALILEDIRQMAAFDTHAWFRRDIVSRRDLVEEFKRLTKSDLPAVFGLAPARRVDAVALVQRLVAEEFSVKAADLRSSNTAALGVPRDVAMYLATELGGKNAIDAADDFADAEQGDVVAARRLVKERLGKDPRFAKTVEALRARITARLATRRS